VTASHKVAVLEDLLVRVRRNARNPAEALAARTAAFVARAAGAAEEAAPIVEAPPIADTAPPPSEAVETVRREAMGGAPARGRGDTMEGPPPRAAEPRPAPPLQAPTPVAAKPSLLDGLPQATSSEPDPESLRYTTKVQGTPLAAAGTREGEKDAAPAEAEKKPRVVALAPPLGSATPTQKPAADAPPPRAPLPSTSTEAASGRKPLASTSTEAAKPAGRAPLPSTSAEAPAAPRAAMPSTPSEVKPAARPPLPSTSSEAKPAARPPLPSTSSEAPVGRKPMPSTSTEATRPGAKVPPAPPSTRGSVPDMPRTKLDSRLDAKPAEAAKGALSKPTEAGKTPEAPRVRDKKGTLLGMGQDFAAAVRAEMAASGLEYEEDNTARMSAQLLAEARAAARSADRPTAPPGAPTAPPPAEAKPAAKPVAPKPAEKPRLMSADFDAPTVARAISIADLDIPPTAKDDGPDLDAPTQARGGAFDLDVPTLPKSKPSVPEMPAAPKAAVELAKGAPLFGAGADVPEPDDDDGDPLLKTVIAGDAALPIGDSLRSDPPPSSQNLAATVQISADEARARVAALAKAEQAAATIPERNPFGSVDPAAGDVFAPTLDAPRGLGDFALDLPPAEPSSPELPPPPLPKDPGVHVPTLQSAAIDPAAVESARAAAEAKWAATAPTAPPAKPKSRTMVWVAVAAFLAVVVGGGIFVALRSGDVTDGPRTVPPKPTAKPSAAPTAAATATATATAAPTPSAAPSAAASAAPTASAATSAAPSASAAASAAASATPSAAPSAAPATGPAPDGSTLPDGMGWLIVQSSVPAEVYVNGKMSGTAGQPIQVPCGARYLRIGKPGQPNFYISEGRSHQIACKSSTTVTINPTPYSGGSPGGSPGAAPAPAGGNNNDPY
jgi:hypothetical protein